MPDISERGGTASAPRKHQLGKHPE
jgi:hypothetical protein